MLTDEQRKMRLQNLRQRAGELQKREADLKEAYDFILQAGTIHAKTIREAKLVDLARRHLKRS